MQDCIFCKIVRGEIPSKKVYEDDDVLAFHDIHPQAPVHFMIMPKRHIASLADAASGRCAGASAACCRSPGVSRASRGRRTASVPIVNTGRIGRQDVMHVHIHIIGGPDPLGPMLPRGAH